MACLGAGRPRFSYQEEYPNGLFPCHAGCQGNENFIGEFNCTSIVESLYQ